MNTWTFVSIVEGSVPVTADSFEGAWRAMYAYVQDRIACNSMSSQLLETAIWIDPPGGKPIFFYNARDRAYDEGIMDKINAEEAQQKEQGCT